jgi:sucrose-6-phosphate hydrolase SacC (GH32 family)
MGDPNGLIYHKGIYHMFYQYEPNYNTFTPNMHWGHACSNDLINWTDLPIALKPDHLGAIWSGSAIVDKLNTSGFGTNTIVCAYTSAGGETYESSEKDFTISIAYSSDGMMFTKYEGNPVVNNITRGNRDPKLFWHKDKWYMIISLNNEQGFHFLCSTNLREWSSCTGIKENPALDESSGAETKSVLKIDEISDCPDIISISDDKYLFFGTNGKYVVGKFDNGIFIVESSLQQFAYGETYSSQIWNNEPNNRNIMIFRLGDMENSQHISQMSIPIEIEHSNKIIIQPLKSIINNFILKNDLTLSINDNIITTHEIVLNTCQFYLSAELDFIDSELSIELIDGKITYDGKRLSYNEFDFDLSNNKINLQILSDMYSVEIFVNNEKYIGCYQRGEAYYSITFNNMYIKKLDFIEL